MKTIDHADLVVLPGREVRLADFDPALTCDFTSKADAESKLCSDIKRLIKLQDVFSAQSTYALLIILQGMDAAGKDGAIKHVMSGVNPQGVHVYNFKSPSAEELAHDYLWRCTKALPERGRIGIFNRSYYEEVGVVRVHTELLAHERLPAEMADDEIWTGRFEDISAYERHLTRNGTIVLKFFLNISQEEQRRRLLERIEIPEKNWKISPSDVRERTYWDAYQDAYSEMLTRTSTSWAPWYVIPADHKWFTRAAIADLVVSRMQSLDLHYPEMDDEQRVLIKQDRKLLEQPASIDLAA